MRKYFSMMIGAVAFALWTTAASAVTISYQATDLSDAVVGEDLWQYEYKVTGGFGDGAGFQLLYAPSVFGHLDPIANPSDWFVNSVDPDALLPADGLFTATTLQALTASDASFVVNFVWLGNGVPGSQGFVPLDATGAFGQPGTTVPPGTRTVPEPGSLSLLALVVAGFVALRRSRPSA